MSEPTARELLVQLTQEAERLRLLDLADRCRSLDELKDCLPAMLLGVVCFYFFLCFLSSLHRESPGPLDPGLSCFDFDSIRCLHI